MHFDQVLGTGESMAAPNILVSIIIPSFNRYELLTHAIRSCIAQTHTNIEIVVVDDCSTDPRYREGTLERFPKTKVLHLPINQRKKYRTGSAQGMTRQEGINVASGQWIAFLDDDDFFYPCKIQCQLQALFRRKMLFCSTNMIKVTHRTVTIDDLSLNIGTPYFQQPPPEILTARRISKVNYINNSTVLIHRDLLEKAGTFRPEKYEDWEQWKRCLVYSNCLYLHEPLVYYTMENQKDYVI